MVVVQPQLTAQSQHQPNGNSAPAANNPSGSSPISPSQENSDQLITVASAEDDLKRLQEMRNNARPSESKEIVTAFEEAERKYPADYRFTFERARLFGKGMVSHDEAFDAVFLAAEKAIDSGKAHEMLDGLMADKDGDFYRLSHGHREWGVIMQALSNKYKEPLREHLH